VIEWINQKLNQQVYSHLTKVNDRFNFKHGRKQQHGTPDFK
jgi:hypothetical protein